MNKLIITLVAALLSTSAVGCFAWQRESGIARQAQAKEDYAEHRAEIMRMHRDCLKRSESDPSIDCAQYPTAIEIREEADTPYLP